MAAMLEELKQKNLINSYCIWSLFPPIWPPNICHVNPKGLITNQELYAKGHTMANLLWFNWKKTHLKP